MAKINIFPVNLSVTLTKLDVFQYQLPIATRILVKSLAEQILADSQNTVPSVPVDTGALASTGRVEQAPGGWAVVYGGPAANGKNVTYANQVHDDLRPRRYKKPGSGPKFVETHYLRRTEAAGADFEKVLAELADKVLK